MKLVRTQKRWIKRTAPLSLIAVSLALAPADFTLEQGFSSNQLCGLTAKCELSPVSPCDPDRGYVYNGTCYNDDGCYYELEQCC